MNTLTDLELKKIHKRLHGRVLDIMGSPWTVNIGDGLDDGGVLGTCRHVQQTISVSRQARDPGSVLLHETLHAIEVTLGIESLDEKGILGFEVGIRQVLRANPIFAELLS